MKINELLKRDEVLGLLLVVFGVVTRIIPHPWNFAPVSAIALFGGVALRPSLALTLPLIILMISDLVLGYHELTWLIWICFFLVSLFGISIQKNPKVSKIIFGTIAGSVFFFLVTNLGVFLFQNMYPKTWAGLVECYVMALPFFRGTFLGISYLALGFLVFIFSVVDFLPLPHPPRTSKSFHE